MLDVLTALLLAPATALFAPPRVIAAEPDNADVIPAQTTTLRFVFDQDMSPTGRSICGGGPSFPPIAGAITWENPRTVVVPVRLEPGRDYALSINCPAARNFRSAQGEAVLPYPISFRTLKEGETLQALTDAQAAEMSRKLREIVDQWYSHRDRKGVDWPARFESFQPRLTGAATPAAFARAAAELLAVNDDLHLTVEVNGSRLATGRRAVDANVDRQVLEKRVPRYQRTGAVAAGRFEDGLGYIAVDSWGGDAERVEAAVRASLEQLKDARGLVFDVRANSGGDESLARRVAARFVQERAVYSTNLLRDPTAPDGWLGPFDRVIEPAPAEPRFSGRVALLIGPACMSSNESFILMMRKTGQRELFGGRTWGSSGNPRRRDLGGGVTLWTPSWKDMTAQGAPIEGVGIAPDHAVEWTPGAGADPVLDAALTWLRAGAP